MKAFIAALLLTASALAGDCANCEDGLVRVGSAAYACPLCDGSGRDATVFGVGKTDHISHKPDPRKSVVRITQHNGDHKDHGSGVLIEGGLVLTAHHVIEDGGPVTVHWQDGSVSKAKVVASSDPFDLAALEVESAHAQPVPVADETALLGETLTVMGFGPIPSKFREAEGRVLYWTTPKGHRKPEFMVLSTEARNGDSGGPVFNSKGELSGIIWGSLDGHARATRTDRLRKFLEEKPMANGPKNLDACPDGKCRKP
jgi:S1-C subfamily serine protease